jgi:hypothetical protein
MAGPQSGRINTHGCTAAPLAAARHNRMICAATRAVNIVINRSE